MITRTKSIKSNKFSSADELESELVNSEAAEGPPRTIGLYGVLDNEKGEVVCFNMMHMHNNREKSVPRPFTKAQKKKIDKAIASGDHSTEIELKFDTVSQPIDFIINTPGGRSSDMFAIYDIMRDVRKDCDITTFGIGHVMSAGTLLLASGTKGKRKIGRNCRVMIHQVSASTDGPNHEMLNEIAEIQCTQERYIRCLAAETKLSVGAIRKLFEKKVNIYMSAEEAVAAGLADIIV